MARRHRVVCAALPLLFAAPAAAQDAGAAWADSPAAAVEQIGRLEGQGRLSEAVRAGEDAARRFPDSGRVQLVAGSLLWMVYRFDDAEASFARAVELMPTDSAPLANLAMLLATRGDDARARALAERAVALDATAEHPLGTLGLLAERQRLSGTPPEPPAGSPAHVLWALVESGTHEGIAEAFDTQALAAMYRRAAEQCQAPYAAFHGYAIAGASAPVGDAAEVTLELYARRKPDLARAAKLRRLLEDERAEELAPAPLLRTYRGLAASERRGFLERVGNLGEPVIFTVRAQLRRRAGVWKIVDATVAADDAPAISLAQLIQSPAAAAIVGFDLDEGKTSAGTTWARAWPGLLVGVAGLALLLWFVARRRR